MHSTELIPHLFRTESGKIVSVLTRFLGLENMAVAEDIASETFLAALENWPYKGIPANPAGWLYTVAKNKAKNFLQRQQNFAQKLEAISPVGAVETMADFSEHAISDSTLQMLFAVCHPAISAESRVALALRILCGFGIDEIASAFLTNRETISKRLLRAKEKLRELNIPLEMPPAAAIDERLDTVLTCLYLLFSEGYYSETSGHIIRKDLCAEAIRLAVLLTGNLQTNRPQVNALLALMCFQASRLDARVNAGNEMVLYEEQDRDKWNQELVARGAYYFHQSAAANELSRYHLEAGIAYWYTVKTDSPEKWENILQLYNRLLQVSYSPVAALNRTYALSKARGAKTAIEEALKLKLENNRFYHLLLGELYRQVNPQQSAQHYGHALELAVSEAEKMKIRETMLMCDL